MKRTGERGTDVGFWSGRGARRNVVAEDVLEGGEGGISLGLHGTVYHYIYLLGWGFFYRFWESGEPSGSRIATVEQQPNNSNSPTFCLVLQGRCVDERSGDVFDDHA